MYQEPRIARCPMTDEPCADQGCKTTMCLARGREAVADARRNHIYIENLLKLPSTPHNNGLILKNLGL